MPELLLPAEAHMAQHYSELNESCWICVKQINFFNFKMTRDVPALEIVGQELAGIDKMNTFQTPNLNKNAL